MVVLLPYLNNMTYPMMGEDYNVFEQAENIREYVNRVCIGPWESGPMDVLQAGVRVRIGDTKDLFMLQMKYGTDIIKNV